MPVSSFCSGFVVANNCKLLEKVFLADASFKAQMNLSEV